MRKKTTLRRKKRTVKRRNNYTLKKRHMFSRKQRRTNTKKGGASQNETFNNKEELIRYLKENHYWIDKIDIYTKEGVNKNERPIHKFTKSDFSKLYELEDKDVKKYLFQFY